MDYRASLTSGSWGALPAADFTVNNYTVVIRNHTGADSAFFRLTYNGQSFSNTIEIKLRGKVVVENELVLKGTDGVYYKITINNGVISAVPEN